MLDVDVVAHAALSGRRSILIVRSIAAFVAAVPRRASLVRAKGAEFLCSRADGSLAAADLQGPAPFSTMYNH